MREDLFQINLIAALTAPGIQMKQFIQFWAALKILLAWRLSLRQLLLVIIIAEQAISSNAHILPRIFSLFFSSLRGPELPGALETTPGSCMVLVNLTKCKTEVSKLTVHSMGLA